MSIWSLVSVRPEDGTAPRVAASCEGRLTSIPALEGYADVADVLAAWPALAPRLRSFDPVDGVPLDGTVLAPVRSPRKLICAGANYVDHLREMGIPELPPGLEPYFFLLPPTSIAGPGDAVVIPADPGARVDWEAELAVVIGVPGHDIDEDDALGHVAGYTIMNDISARDLQRAEPQWLRGKCLDTFAPLGPVVVDPQEAPAIGDMRIRTLVNGEVRQDAPCSQMITGVPELIEHISAGITLEPGDIIATGTPSGVAAEAEDPVFLSPGDIVDVEIEGLGKLRNPVVSAP